MASAATTPNLDLPQWVETEKPERTDFNAAFDAIDTTVASHLADTAAHFGGNIVVSDTEPLNPTLGMVWLDTSTTPTQTYIYLKMNETSGTVVADSSGNGIDAINSGCTIVDGLKEDGGKALQGDGVDDYVELTNFTLSGASKFRISFYAKRLSDQANWSTLFSHYHTAGNLATGFYISYNGSTYDAICYRVKTTSSDTTNVITSYNPPIGQTIKIEMLYTGLILKFTIWTVAVGGDLTEVYSNSTSLSGVVASNLSPPRMLKSTDQLSSVELANWVVDELIITEV